MMYDALKKIEEETGPDAEKLRVLVPEVRRKLVK